MFQVYGGRNQDAFLNDFCFLSLIGPRAGQWFGLSEDILRQNSGRAGHTLVVYGSIVLIYGGYSTRGGDFSVHDLGSLSLQISLSPTFITITK